MKPKNIKIKTIIERVMWTREEIEKSLEYNLTNIQIDIYQFSGIDDYDGKLSEFVKLCLEHDFIPKITFKKIEDSRVEQFGSSQGS